jgi:ribosomal protein S12 methylthiotransferase accessory factor YcaO
MHKEYMETLESLVDQLTLSAILEMLERISHKKAENLREHWQDEKTAKLWEKAARQIELINIDV